MPMIASQVRDILVPLGEYPHILQSASVREAFAMLHGKHMTAGWSDRRLLVFDTEETLVGLLGLQDLLRALMPDYLKATVAQRFAGPLPDDASLSILWQDSFDAQCRYVAEAPVERYMVPVHDTVQASDALTRAAYLMVAHGADMLPVLDGDRVVGVVRIVDVFNQAAMEVLHD
jgi:CBS domain-containing protein